MINGSLYNPHSQGSVERIHIEIRKGLLFLFLDDVQNFNLKSALKIVMNNYNNNVHKVTKNSPNEVFYSTNYELFDKVK